MKKIYDVLNNFIKSNWNLALYVFLSAIGWCFGFSYITLIVMATWATVSMLFFDRVDSILFLFLGAPYIVGDWTNATNMTFNIIAVGIAILGVITFIFTQIFINKIKPQKGKFFYFYLLAGLGYLLGGITSNFNFINFLITLAICIFIYLFYWIILNFVQNPLKYINRAVIGIAILIILELAYSYAICEDIVYTILHKEIRVGAGEINTSAIYLGIATLSCFYLGLKTNKLNALLPLATLFIIGTFFTYSRIALAVNSVMFAITYIVCFIKTKNKQSYLITTTIILCCILAGILILKNDIELLTEYYLNMGVDGNGRDYLWEWCFDRFKENKLFGVGFAWETPVPFLTAQIGDFYLIYAHNIVIQLLTSLGIIGLVLNLPLLIKKYMIIFKSKQDKCFIAIGLMQILTIALCGMFDASGGLGVFMCFLVQALTASFEIEGNKKTI